MLLQPRLQLLVLAGLASSESPPGAGKTKCNANGTRICYPHKFGTGQDENVSLRDVGSIAAYLRELSRTTNETAFWSMPAREGECDEITMSLPNTGSVLVMTKHIKPNITSSVLLYELANTIDGGPVATISEREKALWGCGVGGGEMEVQYDPDNPEYRTPAYIKGKLSPEGILVRIMKNPSHKIGSRPREPKRHANETKG